MNIIFHKKCGSVGVLNCIRKTNIVIHALSRVKSSFGDTMRNIKMMLYLMLLCTGKKSLDQNIENTRVYMV